MITGVRIQNFKAIADSGWIPLKDLNYIMGPNSSGKSAIGKALQFMQVFFQLKKDGDTAIPTFVPLNTNDIDLGTFGETVHDGADSFTISYKIKFQSLRPSTFPLNDHDYCFEFEFSGKKRDWECTLNRMTIKHFSSNQIIINLVKNSGTGSYYKSAYNNVTIHQKNLTSMGFSKESIIEFLCSNGILDDASSDTKFNRLFETISYAFNPQKFENYDFKIKDTDSSSLHWILELITEIIEKTLTNNTSYHLKTMKSYTTKNKNLIKEERNTRAHKNKPNRKDEEFRVSRKLMMFGRSLNRNVPIMDRRIAMSFYQLQDEYGYDRSSLELNYLTVLDPALIIGNVILTMITNIIDFNESLVHIGPIRHTAERTMRKDRTGEGVWAKIYNNKKLQRKKLNYIIKGLDDPRIQDIRFTDDDKSNSFKVEIKGKSGKFRNLLDIGFGFGQVLPVLLKCLDDFEIEKPSKPYKTMPKARRFNMPPPRIRPKNSINKCIIIEEPEVHLHPKLASSVARFFFTFSKDFNRTVIIETHSEHIIQTTQLVIKNVPDLANDTQILFMERKWNKKSANSAINIVNFDKDGTMLDEFPDDFFDYSHDLFKELIRKK